MGTAVVLGAGFAGLLAARVLAAYAERVVLLEQDDPHAGSRRGVGQYNQVHTLLPGGRGLIERWFPGFTQEAVELGAPMLHSSQIGAYFNGVRTVSAPTTDLLCASRPFLERHLRDRVAQLSAIRIVTGRAEGLEFTDGAVAGVRYRAEGRSHFLASDLVIDAMGRASRLSDWLDDAGWPRPPLRRVTTGINYATGYFRATSIPDDLLAAIAHFGPDHSDGSTTSAAVNMIEDRQWMVVLAGLGQHRPGRDLDDFVARCRNDLPPIFRTAVGGEPVGDILRYHQADSRSRDFTAIASPARVLSVGDAVASVNPVYAQGISSAALHAACLADYLADRPDLTEPFDRFFRRQRLVVDAVWQVATATDSARAGHRRPMAERIRTWILNQTFAAAATNAQVAESLNLVTSLFAHPDTLRRPALLARTLRTNHRGRGSGRIEIPDAQAL